MHEILKLGCFILVGSVDISKFIFGGKGILLSLCLHLVIYLKFVNSFSVLKSDEKKGKEILL